MNNSGFQLKAPEFAQITVSKSKKIIKKYGETVPEPPANLDQIIKRAEENLEREKSIDLKDLRALAFNIFDSRCSQNFRDSILKYIEDKGTSRHFSALIASYIMQFERTEPTIRKISQLLNMSKDRLSRRWQRYLSNANILDLDQVEDTIAQHIIYQEDSLEGYLANIGLGGAYSTGFLLQGILVTVAKKISQAIRKNGEFQQLDKFLKFSSVNGKIKPGTEVACMIALMSPFKNDIELPNQKIKEDIQNLFLNTFGDPRISTDKWPVIDRRFRDEGNLVEEAQNLLKKWLNLESIEFFFNLIEDIAPEQFEERKILWKKYFDQEKVVDAYPILGSLADMKARDLKRDNSGLQNLKYGIFSSGSVQKNQCVLLMKIGNWTVAEWSHAGKFRSWSADSKLKPAFYLNRYSADQLKKGSNPYRQVNGEYGDGIIHSGNWVSRAERWIAKETGVRVR